MFLAYFDESGDSGLVNSPTKYFVLCAVLVHHSNWMSTLDQLIRMRGRMRDEFDIPTRPEIKSTDFRRGGGALRPLRLSPTQRMDIYARAMRYQANVMEHITTFAIAINKLPAEEAGREARETAWQFALERVDRFCQAKDDAAIIFPDEGHGPFIRRLLRRMRRYHHVPRHFGGGSFTIPTSRIVEDPNDRKSHDSYFIQLADWNAYAAHRSRYVDPIPIAEDLWDQLAERRLLAVNQVAGGPPGIKIYPQ